MKHKPIRVAAPEIDLMYHKVKIACDTRDISIFRVCAS